MIYSEVFTTQWNSFCNDFAMNIRNRRAAGLDARKLDEWYQLNILRWKSSIETEGVVLEQQRNKELREKLLLGLKNFEFQDIPALTGKKAAVKGWLLVAGAAVLGVLENLVLPTSRIWSVILAVILVALAAVEGLKGVKKANEKECMRRREKYKEQLAAYGETLTALCKSYEN